MNFDGYLYHTTKQENVRSILRNGIIPQTSHRDSLEEDIPDLPVTRQDCVFLYGEREQAELMVSGDRAIIVVDPELISGLLYGGEFRLISDAIDHQYVDEPDFVMISETYEEALHRYSELLVEISNLSLLEEKCESFEFPEILVEGGVDPNAIIGVL